MCGYVRFVTAVVCLFLLGCGSTGEGGGGAVLPPEGALEELPRLREFQFSVGDEVDIIVWRQEEFNKKAMVNPDGNISFDLLGPVKVAGLTYSEFQDELVERIGKYVRDPRIAVNVIKVSDEKIYVLGWVSMPGVYRWNSQMTVVEAISTAGGIVKDVAQPRSIFIASGDVENPGLRIVDYLSIMRDGNFKDNVRLQRGDIVYVPKQFMAHADKFFERYASYFRAVKEGEWAISAYPDMVDALKGDASTRLRILTDEMRDR